MHFFQRHLSKRLAFHHQIALVPLQEFNRLRECGSVSVLINPCVCPTQIPAASWWVSKSCSFWVLHLYSIFLRVIWGIIFQDRIQFFSLSWALWSPWSMKFLLYPQGPTHLWCYFGNKVSSIVFFSWKWKPEMRAIRCSSINTSLCSL